MATGGFFNQIGAGMDAVSQQRIKNYLEGSPKKEAYIKRMIKWEHDDCVNNDKWDESKASHFAEEIVKAYADKLHEEDFDENGHLYDDIERIVRMIRYAFIQGYNTRGDMIRLKL